MGMPVVMAGAAKRVIELPQNLFPMEQLREIHDPLHIRLLYLECDGKKQVFVSLELTSVREYEIDRLRLLLSEILKAEEERIWICVTHTFSAPHTRSVNALRDGTVRVKNEQLCGLIEEAVKASAAEALEKLEPAVIFCANGRSLVNINRDIETPAGWWTGKNAAGYSDRHLPVLCVESEDQKTRAVLYSHDMQSSQMKESDSVSADVAGAASSYIEHELPGCVALFCLGAAGDQTTGESLGSEAESMQAMAKETTRLGECLGGDVINALREKRPVEVTSFQRGECCIRCGRQKRPEKLHELKPVRAYEFEEDGSIETPVCIFTMGDIAIVGVQPELSSVTGNRIRTGSPYACTMALTMVNGGAKYMPDAQAYDRITYEAMNSSFVRGSAEKLEARTAELLNRLWKGEKEG